jgi:hypothetical protein
MLNAWDFVWLCGLKVFKKNLKRFLSKGCKENEKKQNQTLTISPSSPNSPPHPFSFSPQRPNSLKSARLIPLAHSLPLLSPAG